TSPATISSQDAVAYGKGDTRTASTAKRPEDTFTSRLMPPPAPQADHAAHTRPLGCLPARSAVQTAGHASRLAGPPVGRPQTIFAPGHPAHPAKCYLPFSIAAP